MTLEFWLGVFRTIVIVLAFVVFGLSYVEFLSPEVPASRVDLLDRVIATTRPGAKRGWAAPSPLRNPAAAPFQFYTAEGKPWKSKSRRATPLPFLAPIE